MPITTAEAPMLGVPQRPLRRSGTEVVLGGVCGGLAIRFGVTARTVRVVFSLLAFAMGLGLIAYVALWVGVARSGEDHSILATLTAHRSSRRVSLVSSVLVSVAIVVSFATGLRWAGVILASFAIALGGAIAVWRGGSLEERRQLDGLIGATPIIGAASARGWRAVALRVIPGVVMVVIGLNIMSRTGGIWGVAVPAIIGAMALVAGLLVLLAPWWLHSARELSRERRDRVRAEERAAMVTHIHDSVLQTLTLIERVAHNEADVVRLARAQERELRQWLFSPTPVVTLETPRPLSVQLAEIESDIESDYGVKVELVIVGDCDVDERVGALVAASREAALNAAKWSGAPLVSLFAEVEAQRVSLFVRDRGCGFDASCVAADRQGISRSIVQRMNQIGGTACIKSAPAAGTEVALMLPGPHS